MPEEIKSEEAISQESKTLVKNSVKKGIQKYKQAYWAAGAIVVIAIIFTILGLLVHKQLNTPVPTPSLTPVVTTTSPSSSPVVSPSPSASPTVSPSPTASVTPSPTSTAFPDAASTTVASFYSDYKAKNATALAGFFTPDTNATDQNVHDTLFTGVDANGNPGGPTLFSTNSASESVSGYSVQSQQLQGSNWMLTISEQRLSSSGASAGNETTVMILVPSGSGWLIDSYYHQGAAASKYDGFLNPS